MKTLSLKTLILAFAAFLLVGLPATVDACTVCFGDPDSDTVKGAAWAIIFLGAVVMSVMGCVGGFFVYIARRSASGGNDPAGLTNADN